MYCLEKNALFAGVMTAENISLSVETGAPRPTENNQRVLNEKSLKYRLNLEAA